MRGAWVIDRVMIRRIDLVVVVRVISDDLLCLVGSKWLRACGWLRSRHGLIVGHGHQFFVWQQSLSQKRSHLVLIKQRVHLGNEAGEVGLAS